jgi:Zn-dependent protease with chaperone function
MTAVLVLGLMTATCVQAAAVLAAARWPRRAPAAAIVLWQALGLGWGLAAVGTLIGLGTAGQDLGGSAGSGPAPPGAGALGSGVAGGAVTALGRLVRGQLGFGPMALARLASLVAGLVLLTLLVWVLLSASAAVLRARQRQRALLSLLAHGDPKVPGALVVDYPAAAAYCLPGLRSAIVISAGTLDLLDSAELAAVLAHERAHLRERHDLVLLPFVALLNGFAWSPVVRKAHQAVALLIEMHADDMARRHRPARELATALLRVGAAGGGLAPSGTLAAADPASDCDVTARVTRLLRPSHGLPAAALALVAAAATLAIVVPAAVLVMPF